MLHLRLFRASPKTPSATALLALAFLAGCSGGSTGSGSTPSVTVALSGATTVRLSETTQFAAIVSGSANTAVVWEVNGVAGGSNATGTISSSGLYTAPAAMPGTTSVTVSVVSAASATATATVTESLLNPIAVLSSTTVTQVGSTLSYSIDVIGSNFVSGAVILANGTALTTTYVSSTELQATVNVPSGTTTLTVMVSNPNPGAVNSSALTANLSYVAATPTEAARFLDQTSFGPTAASIAQVQSVGMNAYLMQQFNMPTTVLASIPVSPFPAVCLSSNTAYPCAESEWWTTAITGPDQLRQRVAFALSEMFVVSTQSIPGQAIPQFHNALANDAFGNFATIMKDVTLSPAMGGYLNMMNSAAPAAGQIANENYARENMQLFTIGLYALNQDGTHQLDSMGAPIPSYTQAQVQAFARAYTGWTLANPGGAAVTKFPNNSGDYNDPMVAVAKYHDTTAKTLLNGTVLNAGGTAEQDLDGALGNIFADSNVGPFVCTQLIQHLVTSTPSPAYVSRVAAIFANNGNGVRGDMQAVLRAILMDTEARAGDTNASYNGGHLREPILFMTAMMRALNFTNADPNGAYYNLSNYTTTLGERPYRANSVFNFFPPDYVIPGTTLNAPEFGNENSATSILQLSLADSIVNNKIASFTVDLSNTSALGVMATNPANLTDYLGKVFMHSQMPANMRTTIINAITPLTSNAQRVRVAVYLVITSSQYKIIH
ncbi:DUF1800 domain-containing protein [Granulicella paludicola]|uniref:DUF1800 domain-containing protein n=1 Tax=Granulicella paludicola TaxID=474951 RepID=UPI0021DFC14A|nr:DUF1800 domain-containing protein [Granulicella paludicola]